MLTAYFDDSGKEGDSPSVHLCGFVASADQWARFNSDWKSILAMPKFGLDYFHMKEMRQAKQPPWDKFKNNPTLREDLCDRLFRIIKVRTEWSFAGSVVMSDYNAMNQRYQIRETLGPPQVIASALAIQKTIRWRERAHPDQSLRVVCDQGMDHFGVLSDQMSEVHAMRPDPADVKETPGLQAADFVAWALQRSIAETLSGKIAFVHELPPLLKRIFGMEDGRKSVGVPPSSALRAKWFGVDESQLRILIEKGNIPERETLVEGEAV